MYIIRGRTLPETYHKAIRELLTRWKWSYAGSVNIITGSKNRATGRAFITASFPT